MAARHTERATRLVERLLDVSRIATGTLELEIRDGDLAKSIRDTVAAYADLARASGTALHSRAPEAVPWLGDSLRVEQILANLLSNAIKYGSGRPVQIDLWSDASWAEISVADQGPGIAKDRVEKIFERFDRGEVDRNLGGLGLGLYVSRRIAEAHGGTLTVESDAGKGARFVLRLPLRGPPLNAAPTG